MKFFSTLFFLSFSALAYSAALSKPDIEYEVAKREIEASTAKFVPGQLPDGKNSVAVYEGGVFEGTISEGENGEVIVKDAYGNTVNLDDDDEEGGLEKRIIFVVIRVFAVFIKRFGPRAWNFLRCVGLEFAVNQCANKILGCAQRGTEAFECLGGIVCAGKSFKNCAK